MRRTLLAMALMTALVGWVPAGGAGASPPDSVPVCGPVPDGYARCLAVEQRGPLAPGVPQGGTGTEPAGLSPDVVKSIYNFPRGRSVGQGQTIAVVSAFDAPTMEGDLGVFDRQFGLPACTAGNGCFKKLDQNGGTSFPATDPSWVFETHLDVEWAHAIAPGAKILLVEATTNAFDNMITAEDTAKVRAGYVSNSWDSPEAGVEGAIEHHFSPAEAPGVSFFFASGDFAAPAQLYPAASPQVVAVGGTTLQLNHDGRFLGEIGWSNSGGGCSPFLNASAVQAAFPGYAAKGCAGKRATPDVSLDADPHTGVSVYNSQPDENNLIGWFVVGGTSVSTPMVAARAAITGQLIDQAAIYGHSIVFRDILQGNNGFPCTPGYDLVTGRGSWSGRAAGN
jgi:subtilase family serine protease